MAAGAATAMGAASLAVGEITRRGVLQPMIDEAEGFEVEFAQLRFVSGATGDELERLRETAIRTGLETQFSPAEATRAMRMLLAAGLETEEMYRSLQPALDLSTASAGTVSLATAAQVTAAAIAKMGNDSWDARRIMDTYADATRATNLQFEDMRVILNGMGDFPLMFEATAAEVFALGGMLRNVGQLSGQAGQAMGILGRRLIQADTILRRIDESGRQVTGRYADIQRAMERLNVQLFDSDNQLRPMVEVFGDMADALATVTDDTERLRLQNVLLGPQAGAVLTAMGNYEREGERGGQALRSLVARLSDAEGVSRMAAETFEETARGVRIFIQGTVQTIQILLGEALGPALRVVMDVTREILGRFLELIQANPLLARGIGFLVVGIVALSFVTGTLLIGLGALLFALSGLVPILTAGTAVLAGVATALGVVAAAVVALVLVFGSGAIVLIGLSVALYQAYRRNLGGLGDFLDDWGSDLRLMFSGLVDFFRSDDGSISAAIVDQLRERGLLDTVLNILAFTRRLEEAWAGVRDVVAPAVGVIVNAFEAWLEASVAVVDYLEEGLSMLGFQFDENMDAWRTFGQVLGVIIVGAAILAFVTITALTLVLGALALAMFVAMLPMIAFVVAGIGVVLLVVQIVRLFQWLGSVISEWASDVGTVFSQAWDTIMGWADALVEWGESVVSTVEGTFEILWAPFEDFQNRVRIFWGRLTAADAPWRRWAVPWYETNVNQPIVQPMLRGFQSIADFLGGVWSTVTTAASSAWRAISGGLSGAWRGVREFFEGLADGISGAFTGLWAGVAAGFMAAIGWLQGVFAPITSVFTEFGTSITGFFSGLWATIAQFFTSLQTQAVGWGAGLVRGWRSGIAREWAGMVQWFSTNIAQVRDLLPSSDARVGPLSDLTASGSALVTTFMRGASTVFPTLTSTVGSGMGSMLGSLGLPTTTEGVAGAMETGVGSIIQSVVPVAEAVAGTGTGGTGGATSVQVTVGDINLQVQQATPEEAERLAELILERIRTALEGEAEATFA